MKLSKEQALSEIAHLVDSIESLKASSYGSSIFVQWIFRANKLMENVFGQASPYYVTFCSIDWVFNGRFITQSIDIEGALAKRKHQTYLEALEFADGILRAAHSELSQSTIESVFKSANTPTESNGLIKILNLTERTLRKVVKNTPTREVEVQDSFESLLLGADIQYSREPESIEYSSKKYIADFAINHLDLAIEIKLCTKPGHEKERIAEINDDILAYKEKYRNLLFVVYDVGQIRDSDLFGSVFEKVEGVLVRVVKH